MTFVIRSKKIIIEYNGTRWHPHPKHMNEEEWNSWYINDTNADIKYKRDIDKIKTAKNNGYKCLVIWSDSSYDDNMKRIMNFIKENLN